jgi:hypothetical protein
MDMDEDDYLYKITELKITLPHSRRIEFALFTNKTGLTAKLIGLESDQHTSLYPLTTEVDLQKGRGL